MCTPHMVVVLQQRMTPLPPSTRDILNLVHCAIHTIKDTKVTFVKTALFFPLLILTRFKSEALDSANLGLLQKVYPVGTLYLGFVSGLSVMGFFFFFLAYVLVALSFPFNCISISLPTKDACGQTLFQDQQTLQTHLPVCVAEWFLLSLAPSRAWSRSRVWSQRSCRWKRSTLPSRCTATASSPFSPALTFLTPCPNDTDRQEQ